jgi:Xaa-Pro aminopeptidase
MKSNIPKLMQDRQLDAIVVQGDTDTSSDLAYLTGGVHLEGAMYIQRQDGESVLLASPIEREKAAETGYPVRLWSDFNIIDYLKAHDNDRLAATVAQLSDVLREENVAGRVGFYGYADRGFSYLFLNALAAANPQIEVVGEMPPNLFNMARQTKDAAELAAMRRAGRLTTEVIDSVFAFIQAHDVRDDAIVKADGGPLTIGDVKTHIRLEVAKRNLEEVHENIFSQGRDAGVPHNSGQHDMPLRLGQSIIFDIFPRDRTTGYFHDITRTFFLGYAPDDQAQRWQQVKIIFDELLATMTVGERCSHYQHVTCDYFEALGYPTTRSNPKTKVGYNHSLGHGVGLDIHEDPRLSHMPDNTTVLQPGHVVSVEPGLYYPDEGWGIRIEDTIAFDEEGKLVNLSDYPYEMVIPVG